MIDIPQNPSNLSRDALVAELETACSECETLITSSQLVNDF